MKKTITPILFAFTLMSSFSALANTYKFPCPSPSQLIYDTPPTILTSSSAYNAVVSLPLFWGGGWDGEIPGIANSATITKISFSNLFLIINDSVQCVYTVEGIDKYGKSEKYSVSMYPSNPAYYNYYRISLSNGTTTGNGDINTQIIATDIN